MILSRSRCTSRSTAASHDLVRASGPRTTVVTTAGGISPTVSSAIATREAVGTRKAAAGLLTSVERRFVDHDPGGVWTGRRLIDEVSQQMLRNDDWTALDLFKRIGVRDSPSNPASEHEHGTLCRTSQLVRPDLRPAGRQCRGRGRFGRPIATV
jgi:hypothetical protein